MHRWGERAIEMAWKAKTITEIKMQFAFPSVFFQFTWAWHSPWKRIWKFGAIKWQNIYTWLQRDPIDVFLNGGNIQLKPNPTCCGRHKLTYMRRGINKNKNINFKGLRLRLGSRLLHFGTRKIFFKNATNTRRLPLQSQLCRSVCGILLLLFLPLWPNCDHFFMAKVSVKEVARMKSERSLPNK